MREVSINIVGYYKNIAACTARMQLFVGATRQNIITTIAAGEMIETRRHERPMQRHRAGRAPRRAAARRREQRSVLRDARAVQSFGFDAGSLNILRMVSAAASQ